MDEAVRIKLESIEAEDKRQNHRLAELEGEVKTIHEIALSIKELTIEIKHLREDVQNQSQRLEKIENAPLEKLNGAKATARNTTISIIVGAIIGALLGVVAKSILGM